MGLELLQSEIAKILGCDPVALLQYNQFGLQSPEENITSIADNEAQECLDPVPEGAILDCFRLTKEIEANAHVGKSLPERAFKVIGNTDF